MAKDLIALARARKLAAYEGAGLDEHAKRTRSAISDADKAANEDLSKLSKADLVARAEQAGVDTDGKTKAELIDELEGTDD